MQKTAPRTTRKKNARNSVPNASAINIKSAVQSKTSIEDKIDLILDKIIAMDTKIIAMDTKIDHIDTKLTTLTDTVDTLESQFKKYIKRESDIQEATVTEYVYQTLRKHFMTSTIQKHPLRVFYLPSSNDMYTDIDGCLVQTMKGYEYENTNGTVKTDGLHHAVLIEAKHSLTQSLVHYKIQQFCTMKRTLQNIKNHDISEDAQSPLFQNMVATNSLETFPDTLYFFFASDDLSSELKEYIYKISTMTLTKEEYDMAVLNDIKEKMTKVSYFLEKSARGPFFKLESSVEAHLDFFKKLNISIYSQPQQKKVHALLKSLVPFRVFQSCMSELKGTIGVIQFGKIYQFEEGKDIEDTSLFGHTIDQGANLWNLAKAI